MPAAGVFDAKVKQDYESAKEFLLDVVNLRFDRLGVTKIATSERMKAASELLPYTDKQKPKDINTNHSHSWAERVRAAEAQVNASPMPAAEAEAEADAATIH